MRAHNPQGDRILKALQVRPGKIRGAVTVTKSDGTVRKTQKVK